MSAAGNRICQYLTIRLLDALLVDRVFLDHERARTRTLIGLFLMELDDRDGIEMRLAERDSDIERASLAILASDFDSTAVQRRDLFDEGEANSRSSVLSRSAAVRLPETIENVRQLVRLDTDTGIANR